MGTTASVEKGPSGPKRVVIKLPQAEQANIIPRNWTSKTPTEGGYVRVEVESDSPEFDDVQKKFMETMAGKFTIQKVERVQNRKLWLQYMTRKKLMSTNGQAAKEKSLFHGTTEKALPAILQDGFDFRIAGTRVGTLYGRGSYFASKASYSNDYTDCGILILAPVLVGEYTLGCSNMTRPPPKQKDNPLVNLYDCCVNNVEDPTIFVIFNNDQAYPLYLIHYSKIQ